VYLSSDVGQAKNTSTKPPALVLVLAAWCLGVMIVQAALVYKMIQAKQE
jgi:hypothetical protein